MSRPTVLITGAAGRIGQTFLEPFRNVYEVRTCDRIPVPGDPDAYRFDLADLDAMTRAAADVDVIVHLAADRFTPYTSQARLNALVVPVAAEVNGSVISVDVTNNQLVTAGLEPRPAGVRSPCPRHSSARGRFHSRSPGNSPSPRYR